MPLDRRVSFCGTEEPAAWFEELRKNFITLSETDAIEQVASAAGRAIRHFLRRRGRRLSGLSLNINLPFQEGALFNGNALRGHVASYHS